MGGWVGSGLGWRHASSISGFVLVDAVGFGQTDFCIGSCFPARAQGTEPDARVKMVHPLAPNPQGPQPSFAGQPDGL